MSDIVQKKPSHHIYSWLKTGRVNPSIRGHRKLQAYLKAVEKDLTEQQGGPEEMTAAKEILIKSTVEGYGVILLASMYCKKAGILRPDMAEKNIVELQPVLGKQFLAFMNTIRQNLALLGIERRQGEKILSPLEIAAQIDAEKAVGERSRTDEGQENPFDA